MLSLNLSFSFPSNSPPLLQWFCLELISQTTPEGAVFNWPSLLSLAPLHWGLSLKFADTKDLHILVYWRAKTIFREKIKRPSVLDKNQRALWKGQRMRGRSSFTELWMVLKYLGSWVNCLYCSATEDFGLRTSVCRVIHTIMGKGREWVMAAFWTIYMG